MSGGDGGSLPLTASDRDRAPEQQEENREGCGDRGIALQGFALGPAQVIHGHPDGCAPVEPPLNRYGLLVASG